MPTTMTFSAAPIIRNPLGKQATSETWLNGQVASRAEAARLRNNVPLEAPPRFNPHSQPVGGRPGTAGFMQQMPPKNPNFQQSTAEQPLFSHTKKAGPTAADYAGAAGGTAALHSATHSRVRAHATMNDAATAAGGGRGIHAPEMHSMFHGGPPLRAAVPGGGEPFGKGMHGAVVVGK